MADVALRTVHKSYGIVPVIHGVDLEVKSGEFVVFVGPSGCGKSTLLRMIAGLETITDGEVEIGGKVVNQVPSPKRGIAMVFQSYALYPHMTVFENMAFGLRLARTPQAEVERAVHEAARILQIEPYLERMPKALSGGQRQRVAIGRAIVRNPGVFLFDEPLSNLDAALRSQTRVEIAKLHEALDATMIYVTHDQVEAMTLADRIVVLNGGRIEQVGTPLDLYLRPVNTFVAGFIGSHKMNLLDLSRLPATLDRLKHDRAQTLGVRPEHLSVTDPESADLVGTLEVLEQFGEFALVYLSLDDGTLITAKIEGASDHAIGTRLGVSLDPALVHLFDAEGRAIR
jgi:ABC-type sugar transport system ATPase subunit